MLELTFDAIVTARACYAAAKLRIPDLLADGPRTGDELAQAVEAHPRALYRVLRALAAVGLLTEEPRERFGLSELGAKLRSDVPGSMRSWVEFSSSPFYLEAWVDVLHTVRTGGPAFDHVSRSGARTSR
jgi:hypothetical protein